MLCRKFVLLAQFDVPVEQKMQFKWQISSVSRQPPEKKRAWQENLVRLSKNGAGPACGCSPWKGDVGKADRGFKHRQSPE